METIIVDQEGLRHIKLTKSGEYRVEVTKARAEVEIVGMFQTTKDEVVDINLTIVHSVPHTRAETVLKGAAGGTSKIRFFGRIVINPNCGDTQSFLEERILLLSEGAKAEAVPELEILSDDVKCSHAASISQIPEEHVFYLESRGIPRAKAQTMIVDGFLE